ncbi:MAG: molecular chaperone HtpG [Bacteroidota bacterium]
MPKGKISVQTENIFPIIKKFLYSDHEIFLREIIANAVDATSKLKTLANKGEFTGDLGDLTIEVILDEEAKTLTVRDKGIGMSEEEVKKYLNQVAFSSATEFLEKYKDDSSIIGHFGLGFYSSFMVADKVEVKTKSWTDAQAVQWACEGNPEYTWKKIEKEARGTDVIMHINEENNEFLGKHRISELLGKYCKFLPVEIKFGNKTETTYEGEGDDKEAIQTEVDNIINNPNPIWKKNPGELTEEDYKNFYNELYPYSTPPLFWIHLNIDYPFNLTGILYFPKLSNNLEAQKNKVQLYSNQVYVTDDVKDILPEFLTLLHGVIDSPDIPLNVSRSYLQADANVRKITSYITKKVADKLEELFKSDRPSFEEKWENMGVFVKYGMLTDDKFYDRSTKFALLQNIDNEFSTISEYREKIKEAQTDKNDSLIVLYSNDPVEHDSFIKSAQSYGYDIVKQDTIIDNHFFQRLEQKEEKMSFVRVDSNTADKIIDKDENRESVLSEKQQEKVKEIFTGQISDPGAQIELKALSPDDQPVIITKPEFMRRMREMSAMQGMDVGNMPESYNVVINTNHPVVTERLLNARKKQGDLAKHLYSLAMLNQNMLRGSQLTEFINSSIDLLK